MSYYKFTNLIFLPVKTSGQWITETVESQTVGRRGSLRSISLSDLQHRGNTES